MTYDFTTFDNFIAELESAITTAYESSHSIEEAERLAAKFLCGMLRVSEELKRVDLDARMKKTGLKAIRAAIYLQEARGSDKKPSDVLIEAVVNSNKMVADAQNALDNAEVESNRLDTVLQVCREGHVYFRGLAKGNFNG